MGHADEFVGIEAGSKLIGRSPFVLRQAIAEGRLEVYVDPLDRRRKLLRRDALAQLATPRPMRTIAQKEAAAME